MLKVIRLKEKAQKTMEALQHYQVTDSRETVEAELHYNTFDVLMQRVETGELTFDQAVTEYKRRELGELAIGS